MVRYPCDNVVVGAGRGFVTLIVGDVNTSAQIAISAGDARAMAAALEDVARRADERGKGGRDAAARV